MAPRVRRIAAGQTLTVTWEPVHYAVNACDSSAECRCVETWPLTAGHYDLRLAGFTSAQGGQASVENPDLIVGAKPGEDSRACSAQAEFDLTKDGVTVEAMFVCP